MEFQEKNHERYTVGFVNDGAARNQLRQVSGKIGWIKASQLAVQGTIKNLLTSVMIGKLVQQTLRNSCGGGLLAGSHHVAGVFLESPSLMDHTV